VIKKIKQVFYREGASIALNMIRGGIGFVSSARGRAEQQVW